MYTQVYTATGKTTSGSKQFDLRINLYRSMAIPKLSGTTPLNKHDHVNFWTKQI